jgi:hypothetical protein
VFGYCQPRFTSKNGSGKDTGIEFTPADEALLGIQVFPSSSGTRTAFGSLLYTFSFHKNVLKIILGELRGQTKMKCAL